MTHQRKQALANHAIAGVHFNAHTPERPRLDSDIKTKLKNPTRSSARSVSASRSVHSRCSCRQSFDIATSARRDVRFPVVTTKFSNSKPPEMPEPTANYRPDDIIMAHCTPVRPAAAAVLSCSMSSMVIRACSARMATSNASIAFAACKTSIFRAMI